MHEVSQPASQPDVSHLLLDLRDAPEFKQGLPTSFLSWQTRPLKIDNSPVEMVVQLSSVALVENELNRARQARPTLFFGGELLSS